MNIFNGSHLKKAFWNSMDGLKFALYREVSIRQEIAIITLLLVVIFGFTNYTMIEKIALTYVSCMVIVVELINTGIEKTVDRISDAPHPLSKAAKDLGSAAVLLSILLAACVWIVILVG